MRTRLLAVFTFSMAAHASAQITSGQNEGVRGIVFEAGTMKPIEYVNVRHYDSNVSLTTTDSTGSFQMMNLNRGATLVFRHVFYRPQIIKSYDSLPMRVALSPCCENTSEAQDMFLEYCRHKMKYPMIMRRKQIQGEVWVRFSMDSLGNIRDVTMLKDIDHMYAETARQFILTLPVEARKMLLHLKAKEFLLPVVLSIDKPAPTYTLPSASDATVLKPVLLVAYSSRAIQ